MPTVAMFVIQSPDPTKARVLTLDPRFPIRPLITSDGEVDMTCGNCETVLAKTLGSAAQVSQVVLQCPKCEKFNATRH